MGTRTAPLPWLPLRRAVLRAPSGDVRTPRDIAKWGFLGPRNLGRALAQHAAFVAHLESEGAAVTLATEPVDGGDIDACYACDVALVVPRGVILLRPGKALRAGETAAMAATLRNLDVPIIGAIEAPGSVEGGDCLWLDANTLAVGDSYRTNPAGIAQLRALLPDVNVEVFQLPHARGPVECLHLQSLVAFVDADLAVVHRSMAPVALLRALAHRGVDTLELAPDELDTQGANILCTAPRRVVMAAGNPRTASALRENSVHVTEIDGDQLMVIGAGGPTCLTLALDRG